MTRPLSTSSLQFLRPYLSPSLPATRKSIYIRFFNTTRCLARTVPPAQAKRNVAVRGGKRKRLQWQAEINKDRAPVENRIEELRQGEALGYPRFQATPNTMTILEFQQQYESVKSTDRLPLDMRRVCGRVTSLRVAGRKLVFLDILQDGHIMQIICKASTLDAFAGTSAQAFQRFYHLVRRGDIISAVGIPYTTGSAELSISVTELPTILAPSLPQLPRKLSDAEARIRNRHVDMLVNDQVNQTLRLRSQVIQFIRGFLLKDSFLEVQTPIIADGAGGAIARPFSTTATEFSGKELALRIAPEIWLKRLVLGGMDRVFEIGPAFRNEGLDATHNPEFTTCEFYKSFTDLGELILMTENLLSGLANHVIDLRKYPYTALPEFDATKFATPFKRIEFIPAVEDGVGEKLPYLAADDAQKKLLALFTKHEITPPSSPTLPRLLDKLSSLYIEPHCTAPTFIMHHPSCLAPLAKSFLDPNTQQLVSARAELFVHNREIANMYEEENSPFEQRKKFIEQAKWRDEENKALVDESYLEALEWALPPTGGWGCGIDRLVMLFSGATRISDVLPFGSLRNVVNLGKESPVDDIKVADAPKGKEENEDDVAAAA